MVISPFAPVWFCGEAALTICAPQWLGRANMDPSKPRSKSFALGISAINETIRREFKFPTLRFDWTADNKFGITLRRHIVAAIKLKNIPNVQVWFSSEIFTRLGGNDVRHRTTSPSAGKLVYAANTSGGS